MSSKARTQAFSIKCPSCKICFDDFDDNKKKPYCIHPCAHTFCLECLEKLPVKECPICRQKIESKNPNWVIIEFVPGAKTLEGDATPSIPSPTSTGKLRRIFIS